MWASVSKRIWNWRSLWITAPTVASLVILLRLSGLLQPFEWMALDQFFRLRPQETPDSRIVIVGIGEKDIQTLGRWPIDDASLATLIKKIRQQQPRAIGLDLYRDLPVEPGNAALVNVFKTTPNLIGIEKRGGSEDIPVAPPPALKKLEQVASNDIVVDGDSKLRRGMLYWTSPDGSESQETLGLRLALTYLEAIKILPTAATESGYLQLGKATFPIFRPNDGSYIGAEAGGYQMMLNYRGATGSFQIVSVRDVLDGKVPANLMRDRIVFIGPVAPSIKDFFYTPYSDGVITTPETMPGVEVQANLASQILSSAIEGRAGIQGWIDWQEWGWIILWSGVGAILGWTARSPRWAIICISLTMGGLIASSYGAFLAGWWIPIVPAALAMITSTGLLTSYIAYLERQERQTIMNIFGRHVTPEIADAIWRDRDQLLQQGRLLGRKMTATVLFTDLKDFSTVSERTDPEALMSWLNEYMEAMTQIVINRGGIVDKFIGDSIMAVFGVPIARTNPDEIAEDARRSIHCAIEMAKELEHLNYKWQSQGRPTTSMRVGISTGAVVTGSLGGTQRLDYTTLGDSVNVASRLESFDKSLGSNTVCRILVSETTRTIIQDQFPIKFIASVQLKGREQPTKIYQILLEPLVVKK